MPQHPAQASAAPLTATALAVFVPGGPAAHHDRASARPAGSFEHVALGDLTMLGLVGREELIECLQSPIPIGLQAQGLVHPGADALRLALCHRILGDGQQLGIHRRRQPLLGAHIHMLLLSYDCRSPADTGSEKARLVLPPPADSFGAPRDSGWCSSPCWPPE